MSRSFLCALAGAGLIVAAVFLAAGKTWGAAALGVVGALLVALGLWAGQTEEPAP